MGKAKRQAIVVLGMHRSGTSMLAGVLAKLGVQPPKSLMVPTQDNPKGYSESTALMRLHDEALASAGTRWSDWDAFNSEWMESPVADRFVDRLAAALEQEYGSSSLFLVKDRRICRLLPLWQRVLSDSGIVAKFVVPVRHPDEVARSLQVRDELGLNRSRLTWLRHMLDAEAGTRGQARVLVSYTEMLRDWRGQAGRISEQLNTKWPAWSGRVEADIDAFVTIDLRHQVSDSLVIPAGTELGRWITRAHATLMRLSLADDEPSDVLRDLDAVREELDRSSATYAAIVREGEITMEGKIGVLRERLAEMEQAHRTLISGIADLAAALQSPEADWMCDAPEPPGELSMLAERLHALRLKQNKAEESHRGACSALEQQLREMSAVHTQAVEAHGREVEELRAQFGQAEESHRDASSSLEQQLREMSAEHTQAVEAHGREVEELHARLGKAEADTALAAASREAEVSKAREAHALALERLDKDKREAEASLSARFEEISKLTAALLDTEAGIEAERTLRSSQQFECASVAARLEREIELHRRVVSEQRKELRRLQEDRWFKAAARLGRLFNAAPMLCSTEVASATDADIVRQSGLFDRAWYMKRYPDVRKSRSNPVDHYLCHGASEGRDPGPTFSTTDYLRRYPDVGASGVNPLVHYLRHGLREGRVARERKTEKGS